MWRGVDCKDTVYEVTFPNTAKDSLGRLARVLEGLLPEEDICVHISDEFTSIIITVYEELD